MSHCVCDRRVTGKQGLAKLFKQISLELTFSAIFSIIYDTKPG